LTNGPFLKRNPDINKGASLSIGISINYFGKEIKLLLIKGHFFV